MARDHRAAKFRSDETRMKTIEVTMRELEVEIEDMLSRRGRISEELRLLEDDRRHLAWRRNELLHDVDVYSRQREWAVKLDSCRAEHDALRAEISDLLSSSLRDGDEENERRAATTVAAHEDYDLGSVNEYDKYGKLDSTVEEDGDEAFLRGLGIGTIEGVTKKRDQPISVASSSAATAEMNVRMRKHDSFSSCVLLNHGLSSHIKNTARLKWSGERNVEWE